nr:hypothetical protein [Tanacetum cinerariifolium]
NDHEDIGKLGAKGDIGFFIGYSANSVAYRVCNLRTKKIMEMMNVTFDELSAKAFEQNGSRPGLQSMTSGQITSVLELTYAPSTITPQRPSERDLDFLFEPLHNKYLGDRPSAAPALTSSLNTPISSYNVDAPSQQHAQQQRNLTPSPTASAADNVPNAMFEGDLFVNPFATPSTESDVSSTQYVDPSNMHTFYQSYPHDYQLTKDHPLEQVIGEASRSSVKEALTNPACVESMQEELHQFIRVDVSELVSSPDGIKPLTLKWFFKNKHDEENMVIRNKTRLVTCVCQPEGFIDADHPIHVYKLKKALCGLKQAPRAWYDELSTFLLQNGFYKGTIDPTLFTRRFDDDILVVNQSPSGILINQSNYVNEILKKYGLNTCDIIGTPMDIKDKLHIDQIGTPVDAIKYRSMIGALMYLTPSRPDIVHATCDSGFELTGILDADYMRCKDTFKSTSGGAQFLGEKLVSWSLKKQDCTSLSIVELEYVSLSACCAQVLWMRMQLTDYGYHFNKILIYCDSKSAIAISCNPIHGTILDRPTVTSYSDIKRDDGNHSRANIKQALEGLHKGYDRFQTLLSQLEIHGAGVSHEDANQSFDDLYNNLRVFERDVKGTTASSSSNTQNMAFVSANNTSSTNDISTAYSVSSPFVSKSQKEGSASYTDEVIHSFFANQSSA